MRGWLRRGSGGTDRLLPEKTGKSIGFSDQCKSLTRIRRECPEYLAVNAQSAQVTLKRLDNPRFPARLPELAEAGQGGLSGGEFRC